MPDRAYSAAVNVAGDATILIQPTKNLPWNITQVSVEMSSAPTGAVCTLRKNGSFVTLLIAPGDVADGFPPVFLRPGDRLTIEWENCTPGDVGNALIFYEEAEYE
jgi:hypothetical protein